MNKYVQYRNGQITTPIPRNQIRLTSGNGVLPSDQTLATRHGIYRYVPDELVPADARRDAVTYSLMGIVLYESVSAWTSAADVAAEAEAERIANKSLELKQAENNFLSRVQAVNVSLAIEITPADGFPEIEQKITGSAAPQIERLEASSLLRNAWDQVLFYGGRFGDVQYHELPLEPDLEHLDDEGNPV